MGLRLYLLHLNPSWLAQYFGKFIVKFPLLEFNNFLGHPVGVKHLAITEDKKVITVEQFRPGPNKVLLELPGGYMDEGETPEESATRELKEETGYEGDVEFVTECFDDAYVTMVRSCFVATNCKLVAKQQLDDGEFINVKLVDLDEFIDLARRGQMTDVEVALLGLDKLGLLK